MWSKVRSKEAALREERCERKETKHNVLEGNKRKEKRRKG